MVIKNNDNKLNYLFKLSKLVFIIILCIDIFKTVFNYYKNIYLCPLAT